MLNYIWAGLIVASFAFALYVDLEQTVADPYRDGRPLAAALRVADGSGPDAARRGVEILVAAQDFVEHFGAPEPRQELRLKGMLVRSESGESIRFASDAALPEPLATMKLHQNEDKELRAAVRTSGPDGSEWRAVTLVFDPVRWVRIKAIQTAAIDTAKTAVTLSLGLIGVLALWIGLMAIAEAAGLINVFVRLIQPLLRPLFPQVPPGHPAFGMIALNLAANMLGLGNAATPFGIKAMEELQKLNPSDDTATDPMVMFLAINTASVQLMPPATLVALMGVSATAVFIPILIVTGLGTLVAIVATLLLGRLGGYRRSDPNRDAGAAAGRA